MPTFLDLRTSQGSKTGAVSTSAASPTFVAGIGLNVNSATNIRVDLEATVGIAQAIGKNTITLWIVRNTAANVDNFATGTIVFSQIFAIESYTTTTFSISAADIAPTPTDPGQLSYGLFVNAAAANATFNGTQNLIGSAAFN